MNFAFIWVLRADLPFPGPEVPGRAFRPATAVYPPFLMMSIFSAGALTVTL